MAPERENREADSEKLPSHGSETRAARRELSSSGKSRGVTSRRPVLRFIVVFLVLMGPFAFFFYGFLIESGVFRSYLELNAAASAWILRWFGEDVTANGFSLLSTRTSLEIRHGCDALLPSALFVSAVLASPVSLITKIPGMIAGVIFLLLMNLVRIATLFYAGVFIPRYFERMHLEVWPAIFILVSLTLWVIWARWARDFGQRVRHETG